ncbi:tyrosine-type recombinase/integrase [Novosphingobium sp. JCM 18896]|uniref:tyrosine-type recombinase/integrase n=1 Tax=Novosphingobium sp. JCM 18896 TaxID=2989731 RepID=UPI002223D803|nr:site-specific integrase [Novosphingobium sp. JCM 18896]MCW1431883.1 tyrosine-type recombinase/integrase [Novosphingobium sp. JCM 18896]
MPKIKLDSAFCRVALCEAAKRKTDYYDTQTTGFTLECRASGGKTYYLRYSDEHGKLHQIKIGRYEDISFDDARKRAKIFRSEVVLGGNPVTQKAERKAIPTYGELADQHIADAKTYLKRPENIEQVIEGHIRPRWGHLRLSEITQQAIASWLAEKLASGLSPATIEKIRITFNRSFELAAKWGIPGGQVNPVKGVARRKYSNARQRYLTTDQAKSLHKAVEASSNTQLRYIVGLLLLTGARKSELMLAKWEHIDLERKAWFIPDTKTGAPRHVPLSQAAISLIEQLPKFEKCDWLLPNPDTKEPFVSIKRAWDTARKDAGLAGLRLHDLRHSAASFMINAGIDLYAVGRILGHADHKSTMRYSHLANDTLLKAVEAGASGMNVSWAEAAA